MAIASPILVGFLLVATTASAQAGELDLKIVDGRVTLKARDVTVTQILREWARVGSTKVVNLEKITSDTVSLDLLDVPERQALDTLLRTTSGYVAATRATPLAGASQFDRILVMPPSVPPAAAAVSFTPATPGVGATPTQVFRPVFPPRRGRDGEEPDGSDDVVTGQAAPAGAQPAFGPPSFPPSAPQAFPGAPVFQPAPNGAPDPNPDTASMPASGLPPGTAATPGIIIQPPQPTGTPQRTPPR
jgi:hypothetical protein